MSFLVLKDNKVECTRDGYMLPEVQRLSDHKLFGEIITALYFLYTPRGLYWNKSISERAKRVNSSHLATTTVEEINKIKWVKELTDVYISLCQTIYEQMEESLKTDIEDMMKSLSDVPSRIPVTLRVGAQVLCDDNTIRQVKIEKSVQIPNIEGKTAIWKFAQTLSENFKKIQENLRIEADERVLEESCKRMFDGEQTHD